MIDIDFKFYRAILWRRLPLILIIWILIAGIGIAVAYLLPPVYRSEARILVEKPQINANLATQTLSITSGEIIQAIQQRMQTRSNMLDVAARLNVFDQTSEYTPSQRVEQMRRATAFNVIQLGGGRARGPSTTMFTVSFSDQNPRLAANVTNEFVTLIQQQNTQIRTTRVGNTADFFEQEVTRLSNELADLEEQIVIFENQNADALPTMMQFSLSEISRIQNRLLQIDTQELGLLDQKNQIERVIADPSLASTLPNNQMSPEERQLVQLNAQMAQLKAIYSDSNNRVVQIQAQIDALQAIISGSAPDPNASTSRGPSQLQLNLEQVNANLEFLAQQRKQLEADLDRRTKTLEQTPNVGMQLNVLTRKHAALQNQFDTAVVRLNAAATGESIEVRQQGERFEVIEQASVPETPESPNRILIAFGAIVGGLGAGFGLIILLEMFNKSVRRPSELVSSLGIQPFGTVPYIATHGEVLRARLKTACAILVVGIGIPAALYVIHYQYMPIDLILSKVIERFGLDDLSRTFG